MRYLSFDEIMDFYFILFFIIYTSSSHAIQLTTVFVQMSILHKISSHGMSELIDLL